MTLDPNAYLPSRERDSWTYPAMLPHPQGSRLHPSRTYEAAPCGHARPEGTWPDTLQDTWPEGTLQDGQVPCSYSVLRDRRNELIEETCRSAESEVLHPGSWVQVPGFRILDPGSWF